jgi:hypothetical protein
VYDAIGSHISSLSEELSKLRQFKNYTQRNGLQEALSDVSELVLTRISDIKEQISKLQRQNYYADFAESFSPATEMPIPEETVNSWVDALTIRTFNEELKSVFPFIYRLVDQPTSLGYDDLVGEATEEFCDACDKPKTECICDDEGLEEHNHLESFEQHLDSITSFDYDVQEGDDEMSDAPTKTNSIEINGKEVDVHTLEVDGVDPRDYPDFSDAYFSAGSFEDGSDMSDEELDQLSMDHSDLLHELAFDSLHENEQVVQQPVQTSNAREVVEFIMSMYDQQQGTFPKGEEGVKIAVEKRFGDHAGQFASQVVERLSAKEQLS